MIIDITQTTKIDRVYRAGSELLKTLFKKSGKYTTTSFSKNILLSIPTRQANLLTHSRRKDYQNMHI